ncbi:lysophospholipase [Shinella sp. S4-D37]|uniref:alpha/beta hydrolase family protein n=1 Tax=Shinella sp. S4-D37 TaxID=3161999 RepID=UPI003467B669
MAHEATADRAFRPNRRNLLLGMGALSAGLAGAKAALADAGTAAGRPAGREVRLEAATTVSARRLDENVARAFPLFNAGAVVADFDAASQGALDDVQLYRVVTATTVPETGEVLDVTGLLALPAGAKGELPVVSWQHGTILSFDQVPSNLTRLADPAYELSDERDSLETLFNVHRFAARGFAVVAADYLGKGPLRNGRGEAYVVKDATVKACTDILEAGLSALETLNITPGKLFLHGWSQGAINTQWLHQSLRASGLAIKATAVARPFNDALQSWRFCSGKENFPLPAGTTSYPEIPAWLPLCMIVLLGSYERHYGLDGLIECAVRPKYRVMARKYWNDYSVDFPADAPYPTATDLMVDGFMDGFTDERNSAFLRHLATNSASWWDYDSPIRFHYGLADEAIHPEMVYRALSAGGRFTQGISIAGASHRATFIAGLYGNATSLGGSENAFDWFNELARS